MSRRPPVSRRALVQLVLAAATLVAVAGVLSYLRGTAPSVPADFVVPGAADPRGAEDVTVFTCERTLPDEPARPTSPGMPLEPSGRVQSSDVVACPDLFDPNSDGGPPIEYIGEVVGDVLERDRGAWVLMNDDIYAVETGPLPAHERLEGTNTGLTVWLPEELVDLDELAPGRPGLRGDVLRVAGRIHRVDPHDGGGLTVRAFDVEIMAEAAASQQPVHGRQAVAAVIAAAAAAAVWLYERSVRLR